MTDLFTYAEKAALRARDRGMARAADAQDAIAPLWSDRAFAAIVRLAKSQATLHVDDVLTSFTEQPSHPNSWGSVYQKAIRAKVIEHSGQVRRCKVDVGKYAHLSPVYRSLIHNQTRRI